MPYKNEINCENPQRNYGSMATVAQSLAVIAQSFLSIGLGLELTISTIVIRVLYGSSKSAFSISQTEAAWYGSIIFIAVPIGCLLSGVAQEKFGKKRCMIFTNIPSIIGWMFLYFAQSSTLLCASNLLLGFSIGFTISLFPPYVGEITEPRLRGIMASLLNTASYSGQLLNYGMSSVFDWRTVVLLCACCPTICLFLVIFIPESPIWLIAKGKHEKAEKSLQWLRGWVESDIIKPELHELIHYNEVSGTHENIDNTDIDTNFFSKLGKLKDPLVYRPFNLVTVYFFVSFVICFTPGRPFLGKIMSESGLINHQNLYLVIIGCLLCIASIVLTLTIHRLGKRFLTLLTVSINSLLLILFGIYIIAMKNSFISSTPWVPLLLLCSINFCGACGVSSIPWMLLGEIFPNKNRGFMTGACTSIFNILLFAMTKMYLTVQTQLSLEYTMIMSGCIGIIGFIYFYIYLPETENKTLLEIEECFLSNSKGRVQIN